MDLPEMDPGPVLVPADVVETVRGLHPGWYPSSYLYQRYGVVALSEKREPVHPLVFGRALKQLAMPNDWPSPHRRKRKRADKVVHGWLIGPFGTTTDQAPVGDGVDDLRGGKTQGGADRCGVCSIPLSESSRVFGLCLKHRSVDISS